MTDQLMLTPETAKALGECDPGEEKWIKVLAKVKSNDEHGLRASVSQPEVVHDEEYEEEDSGEEMMPKKSGNFAKAMESEGGY